MLLLLCCCAVLLCCCARPDNIPYPALNKQRSPMQVDAAVVEVGLGGARDATNVLPPANLAAAVITAVGHDHAAALGGGIQQIAAAKAGIMQEGRPVVLAAQAEAAAERVLLERGEAAWLEGSWREMLLEAVCRFRPRCVVFIHTCSYADLSLLPSLPAAKELGCPVVQASQEVQFGPLTARAEASSSSGTGQLVWQRHTMFLSGVTAAALAAPGEAVELGKHITAACLSSWACLLAHFHGPLP